MASDGDIIPFLQRNDLCVRARGPMYVGMSCPDTIRHMPGFTVSKIVQAESHPICGHVRVPLRNPSAAEMFLGDIEDAVGSLERFPYAHMVRPGSNAAGRCEGCQSSTAKSAVHSISSKMESKTVRVVRVAKHPTAHDIPESRRSDATSGLLSRIALSTMHYPRMCQILMVP